MSNKDHKTMRPGELAWLLENDCFGTKTIVRVVKVHKGGNAIVMDGDKRRECSAQNLRSIVRFDLKNTL